MRYLIYAAIISAVLLLLSFVSTHQLRYGLWDTHTRAMNLLQPHLARGTRIGYQVPTADERLPYLQCRYLLLPHLLLKDSLALDTQLVIQVHGAPVTQLAPPADTIWTYHSEPVAYYLLKRRH